VLAFPRGAAPEVVADGETGYLCADVEEMAAAVDRVGEIDPHSCRARVEKMFSAQAMTTGYEEVYARVSKG
jgi:glycosyltransferase involved in cell wall biosynthesis